MFGSTWIFAVAIGLTAFCFTALGQEQKTQSPQRQESAQQAPSKPRRPIRVEVVHDKAAADARESERKEAEQREIKDLIAQEGMNRATQEINDATQDMRDCALYSTLIVGVGTVLLFWTLWLTHNTGKSAQEAVRVTEKTGRDQSRAYVHVKSIHLIAKESEGAIKASCTFYIENSGATPCKRFDIQGGVEIVADGEKIDTLPDFEDTIIGWSALRGSEVLTAPVAFDMQDFRQIESPYVVHIGGVVRYTTFFDEDFKTEFSFMRRVQPRIEVPGVFIADHASTSMWVDARMSRTPVVLSVYERCGSV